MERTDAAGLRVLIVTPRYPPNIVGGGEISVQLTAEQLARAGAQVDVLSFDGEADGEVEERIEGVRLRRRPLPRLRTPLGRTLLARRITAMAEGYDLAHAYNMFLYEPLALLAPHARRPIVATLNNWPELPEDPALSLWRNAMRRYKSPLRARSMRGLDHCICQAAHLKDGYAHMGLPAPAMSIVPNMVEPRFLEPARSPTSHAAPVIAYVGGLFFWKGVDILLRGFARVLARHPDTTLLVAGKGYHRAHLEDLARQLSIDHAVRFLGFVASGNVIDLYDSADVFVHPGRWREPFGRSVLEAMARGLPVVTSDVGHPPRLIEEPDYVFRSGDDADLAERLSLLIEDPEARTAYGRRLRERALDYTPERVIPQLLDVYEQAIAAKQARRVRPWGVSA